MCSVTVTFTDKRSYVPDEPACWQKDDEKWPHGWQVDPLQATGNDFIELIQHQSSFCYVYPHYHEPKSCMHPSTLYVCSFLIKHLCGCFLKKHFKSSTFNINVCPLAAFFFFFFFFPAFVDKLNSVKPLTGYHVYVLMRSCMRQMKQGPAHTKIAPQCNYRSESQQETSKGHLL